MPPKQPTLKFKPKLIVRAPPQPDASAAGTPTSASASTTTVGHGATAAAAGAATMMASSGVDMDDLTLVQLERLRRVQQQQQSSSSNSNSGAVDVRADNNNSSKDDKGASGSAAHDARATTLARGGGSRVASAVHHHAGAAPAAATAPSYAHAALYPATAPALPVNTMQRIAHDGDDDSAAAVAAGPHTTIYAPIALGDNNDGSSSNGDDTDTAVAATTTTTTTDAGVADGTAFLRAWQDETRRSYAANLRFYHTTLAPLCLGDAHVGNSGNSADGGDQDEPTPARTRRDGGGGGDDGDVDSALVWLQLPRFHTSTPPFTLSQLPPGKVGELKVMRSGRVVMELAGVRYDVAVEGDDAARHASSTVAVATVPPPQPADPTSRAACYELGALRHKLVCTPTLDDAV